NGVIENYAALKKQLQAQGFVFQSDTDTEVIAQLIASYLDGDLVEAVNRAIAQLKGTYGLAVISPPRPDLLVGARPGSPRVLGLGEGENFLASAPGALGGRTARVVYLQDRQMCVLEADSWHVLDRRCERVSACVCPVEVAEGDADKGEFEHHMLKEIYEQPEALENAMRGRLD